jgi:hypothetical protein
MRTVELPAGEQIPVLGQGTWGLGEHPMHRDEELTALRSGLDLEMTLVDTAEMYGDGAAERLVGDAVFGRRDEAFLVTKVLPEHADRAGVMQACERSLHRLTLEDFADLDRAFPPPDAPSHSRCSELFVSPAVCCLGWVVSGRLVRVDLFQAPAANSGRSRARPRAMRRHATLSADVTADPLSVGTDRAVTCRLRTTCDRTVREATLTVRPHGTR